MSKLLLAWCAVFGMLCAGAVGDHLYICQHRFSVKEGFYVYDTDCSNYDDQALAKANFNEDRELWIRNGTIEDVRQLLNGSLYDITNLKITNFAQEGSTAIPVFPIDSMRFSILDLSNDGIERLEITEDDHRLTHLDVRKNKLTDIGNVKHLIKLESLKVDNNAIESVSLDDFKHLWDLLVLSLAVNRITSITATEEISLLKLRSIDISDNQLTTLDVSMWRFPQVSTFYMHDNSLTRIDGLRGKFSKTWDISMGGRNNWDCAWFDRLLEFLKKDRQFAMQMFGDKPSCPDETRMEGFVCCNNTTNVISP
ncbi:leucine-rich repeat-containing protein 40 [Aedes albopictus]|uniref:Cpij004912 membrane glycoprotein lig-1 n=1 Tax=Aedes albopictus TaxID=7160 RepID=A0ABM1YP67_AEDAL